jgi:hypothetical protein
LSPEGLLQLKKLKAHEHYLNSKCKKREANPLGRRPTNKLHHNNYNVDNLSQNIDNVTTTTTTTNNNNNNNNNEIILMMVLTRIIMIIFMLMMVI